MGCAAFVVSGVCSAEVLDERGAEEGFGGEGEEEYNEREGAGEIASGAG